MLNMPKVTPITILTGYLGSGKTTLLHHLLHSHNPVRVAVMVNDFGSVNIDSRLIVGDEMDMIILANGCIYCPIQGDFVSTVFNLTRLDEPPEHIIVEASGVADPAQMVLRVNRSGIRNKAQIDSIMAIVDAEQISLVKGKPEKLIRDQIHVSDVVIINKTDLISSKQVESVERWVQAVSPNARIITAEYCKVPIDFVLGIGAYDPQRAFDKSGHGVHVHKVEELAKHEHHDLSLVFGTWTWRCDDALSIAKIRQVLDELPKKIFRAKGILFTQDMPDKKMIFQMVGKRVILTEGDAWDKQQPASEIVLIGDSSVLDANVLTQQFESTRASGNRSSDAEGFWDGVLQWLRVKG